MDPDATSAVQNVQDQCDQMGIKCFISTWDDEANRNAADRLLLGPLTVLQFSRDPGAPATAVSKRPDNQLRVSVGALPACEYLLSAGCEFILKLRSDQVFDVADVIKQVENGSGCPDALWFAGLHSSVPFFIADDLLAGPGRNVRDFFEQNILLYHLSVGSTSIHGDMIRKYLLGRRPLGWQLDRYAPCLPNRPLVGKRRSLVSYDDVVSDWETLIDSGVINSLTRASVETAVWRGWPIKDVRFTTSFAFGEDLMDPARVVLMWSSFRRPSRWWTRPVLIGLVRCREVRSEMSSGRSSRRGSVLRKVRRLVQAWETGRLIKKLRSQGRGSLSRAVNL